jgi:hypothetical protein
MMINILKKLLGVYCILIFSVFGIGYVVSGLETLGVIPPPPIDWKDN